MWHALYWGNWTIFEDKVGLLVSIGVQSLAVMLLTILLSDS
jgi:hypothetical protein